MRSHLSPLPVVVLCALVCVFAVRLSAQTIYVGFGGWYSGNLNPSGIVTAVELAGADIAGEVTTATFGWSASPCPAAATIKFFRPVYVSGTLVQLSFLAARGPFDVTELERTAFPKPPVTQTVLLVPPVSLQAGDLVAITNVTSCGGPTRATREVPLPRPPQPGPPALVVSGDVVSTISRGSIPYTEAVYVSATGGSPELRLLNGRFAVTLQATNPRNGATTAGASIPLGDGAGYFSLPAFTGNAAFPEVMVKMVDATGSAALGADFWFFHAPLTDVGYTLTVSDGRTGAVRTYSNSSASSGELCGAADTSAFPGP